ncbi:regulator of Vps4 activity in the MVB pathway-domain-containing protein [Crepidotus variabilis]|uniref:Regulator of Vps4 activity in the MVB pathway-domain-containing protein n=1 Tax=Crepidotus variabilis TaxID=179855 RepID=A0A9P6EMZ0_9AGAR|nr:regulator of Vps4 activity in the MVB pathway-domain-containing protein [Crepidotus variabilis]
MLWNATKAKVQLRLSVQRLRTLQQKKEAQAKANRRDIATLIEKGKLETARIKVETIINEDVHVELLELLELYCELLLARFGLLDMNTREPDPGISEGVCSIIQAATRTEIKELHILREILMHKFGREFAVAVMENKDDCVPKRVMTKLTTTTPSAELVDAYLTEIAKAYGVPWSASGPIEIPEAVTDEKKADDSGSVEGQKDNEDVKAKTEISPSNPDLPTLSQDTKKPTSPDPPEDEFDLLSKRFAALKKR